MDNNLTSFIAHARQKGMDHNTIRMILLSAGWKEKDIAEAMTAETLDMPVPLPPDAGGARDAFFHLLNFASLYTLIISLALLFFTYINRLLPDAATDNYYSYDSDFSTIRWSIAALIVAYPIFLLISRSLLREMKQHVEKAASGIRRWLTYLTLFVAAGALMGDLITLIFYLLQGELSLRFILKVFVVLVLTGGTFGYYFTALKTSPQAAKATGMHTLFGWFSFAIVAVAIVWGIWIVGSPTSGRLHQFDDRRLEDLRAIDNEIISIVRPFSEQPGVPVPTKLNKPLPPTLQEVALQAQYQKLSLNDPQTRDPYEYRVLDAAHFELCATFNFVRDRQFDIQWNHPAGHHCFRVDVLENIVK